jgi:N,N'-diacetyllegionaminate synthase
MEETLQNALHKKGRLKFIVQRNTVFIIAEAGVNHNGSIELAKKMITAASETGADAVKFQTFTSNNIISRFAPKAEYQKKTTERNESQLAMVKRLELSSDAHWKLMDHCHENEIMFLSAPFDMESIDLLSKLGLEVFKIPSGEMTNLPYLRKIGGLKKSILLSTGMADLGEIEDALDILVTAGTPKDNITILHCNTEYPTPIEDVNLRAMLTIQHVFNVQVGYSDHTLGIEIPIAAVALGATVIEKHFTLDRNMPGPDHKASLEPYEFKTMISAIRHIERALGDGIKRVSPSEQKNRPIARKSIVAKRSIKKGEYLTDKNITTKRPGTGISPMEWDNIVGLKAMRNFEVDEIIEI